MLADFLTKSLQGELFWKFRDVIMGHKHVSTLLDMVIQKKTSKESIEQNGNPDTTWTADDDVSNQEQ